MGGSGKQGVEMEGSPVFLRAACFALLVIAFGSSSVSSEDAGCEREKRLIRDLLIDARRYSVQRSKMEAAERRTEDVDGRRLEERGMALHVDVPRGSGPDPSPSDVSRLLSPMGPRGSATKSAHLRQDAAESRGKTEHELKPKMVSRTARLGESETQQARLSAALALDGIKLDPVVLKTLAGLVTKEVKRAQLNCSKKVEQRRVKGESMRRPWR